MKSSAIARALAVVVLLGLANPLFAVTPVYLGLQGRLADDQGVAITSTLAMTVRIYDTELAGEPQIGRAHV